LICIKYIDVIQKNELLTCYMDASKIKMVLWGILSSLSWVTYGWSISLYFSDGEKGWALSIWCVVIFSLITFGFTFLLNVRNLKTKAMYALIALLPGLLVFPTASFLAR